MTFKTFSEAYNWYWNHKAKRQRQALTFRTNAKQVFNLMGNPSLLDMSKGLWWIEFQSKLQDTHSNLTPSTINRIVSTASTVYSKTFAAGLHPFSLPRFERCKEQEARLTWFSKDQVAELANTAYTVFNSKDLADAIIFSAYTGLRQGELLQIKPNHVNLDKNIITIGGKDFKTKGLESRIIPLHPKVKAILLNRLEKPLLFGGDYTNKDQMYNLFKKVKAYNGFDNDYVWHSLRHSFGTWLGEKTNPRQIMALMGHKDIKTSMRYVHVSDETLHNSISLI